MGSHLLAVTSADADEDYINMELISSPTKPRSPQNQIKEFEFQHFSTSSHHKSAADELFYKGKLLPLHLPPRRQMVEHLLRTTAAAAFDENRRRPSPFLTCSTAPCTNSNTPLYSCNISPSESCRVSCELNPHDTLFEWPTELSSFFKNQPANDSWSKKLKHKLIKHSFLSQKLKSSRAYLKSLFIKSTSSHESSADNLSMSSKFGKKIATLMRKTGSDDDNSHRRSFSGAISAHSTTKGLSNSSSSSSTASSSSSFSSNEKQFLRRNNSAAEIGVSIDAAIAHCKKSMQIFASTSN